MEETEAITELKGCVTNIIFRNEENLYTVFELDTGDGGETVTGYPAQIRTGDTLAVTGAYREHPVYGPQFVMESCRECPPGDAQSIRRYLASGAVKGIGEALAGRIVRKFGDDTLRIMEEEPERLAEIKGISEKKAREISAQMSEKRDLREAMLFLQQYGISNRFAVRIWQKYGMQTYAVLRENPYRLAEDIQGIGFARADEIARAAGIRADSDYRIRSGILFVLSELMAEGSVYLPRPELLRRCGRLLEVPQEPIDVQIDNLAIERKIHVQGGAGEIQVYAGGAYYEEQQIARRLLELAGDVPHSAVSAEEAERRIRALEKREGIALDPLQREAVKQAAQQTVLLLTGGPGTGKTTTINTIIQYLLSEDLEVLLCAPTGRAAKRMSEATGYEARTIHRLLGVRAAGGTGGEEDGAGFARAVFTRDQNDPLEADAIIVDEMSMVDMHLFLALLKAVVPGTRLIMAGDVDQLPSVGPGRVLQDLLSSGAFCSIVLEKIFRQAAESDIVMNAHRINGGQEIRLDTDSRDFFFLERDSAPVIYKHTVQLLRDRLPGYVHCEAGDIQVLTPMRKGALGVEKLNEVLQWALNPPGGGKRELTHGDGVFREGDKVMQTRNNYQLAWEIPGRYGIAVDSGTGVFNGDFGIIQQIDSAAETVTVRFDEGRTVRYSFSEADELELSYAVTVHKSQGSEYPAVILPLLSGPPALMNRNLLYTAVTRARSCVVLIGSREAVRQMIGGTNQTIRYTGLRDRIHEIASAGRQRAQDGAG